MKYCITYKIDARYMAEVEADSLEEAMQKADGKYMDANFGDAYDIDGEKVIVEDEVGNYLYERY